jgi:hypothetical protein
MNAHILIISPILTGLPVSTIGSLVDASFESLLERVQRIRDEFWPGKSSSGLQSAAEVIDVGRDASAEADGGFCLWSLHVKSSCL